MASYFFSGKIFQNDKDGLIENIELHKICGVAMSRAEALYAFEELISEITKKFNVDRGQINIETFNKVED